MPIIKSVLSITLVFFLISSCKKDDPDPDYVGNWVALGTVSTGETTLEMKDIITISKGSFNQKVQVKNPSNNSWIDYFGTKGTLTVTGTTMNVTLTEAGLSAVSPVTSFPTGTITYYKSTDPEFTQIVNAFQMLTSFQSQYIVNGTEITIKTDLNSDADFNDEGEVTTYTRQ